MILRKKVTKLKQHLAEAKALQLKIMMVRQAS